MTVSDELAAHRTSLANLRSHLATNARTSPTCELPFR